jgi:uncharacterized membrane protein
MKLKLALAFLFTSASAPAFAELRVCNHGGLRTWIAVGERMSDGSLVTRGWTPVDGGGACATVVSGNLRERFYFLHGYDEEGMEVAGDRRLCVVTGRYFNLWNADRNCTGAGREWRDFLEVDTSENAEFTFDLYDR